MKALSIVAQIDLLVYAIILNMVMYYYLNRNGDRDNYSTKLFKRILLATIFVAVMEAISWSTGELNNTSQIPIHYWSNVIFLALTGLTSAFGMSYLDYMIFRNPFKSQKRLFIYLIPTYINIAFAMYNHIYRGFLFEINNANQYIRGMGVVIGNLILYMFAILVVCFLYSKFKRLISGRITQAILVFLFIPVLGSILQTLSYGTTFGMPAYTLASFLTFLLVEKDEMAKDSLTQLYTRGNFDNRLRYKLRLNDPFTVMMIDLNDFKIINDSYGHLEGDKVLRKVSDILKNSVSIEDTVCRYGGDEFILLVENKNDIGEKLLQDINHRIEIYNKNNASPYTIALSYGYDYIDHPRNETFDDVIAKIDERMYRDKEKKKTL